MVLLGVHNNLEYLKKVAEFAEEFAEFAPGICRARALGPLGPGPTGRGVGARYYVLCTRCYVLGTRY